MMKHQIYQKEKITLEKQTFLKNFNCYQTSSLKLLNNGEVRSQLKFIQLSICLETLDFFRYCFAVFIEILSLAQMKSPRKRKCFGISKLCF